MSQCTFCSGTGKKIHSVSGSGVVLDSCKPCHGSGILDSLWDSANKSKAEKDVSMSAKTKTKLPESGTGIGDIAKNVGSQVVAGFVEAGKQEIATAVTHKMVDASKQLAASLGFDLPPNPVIDKALAIGMPILLMLGVQMLAAQDQTVIPKGLLENINSASTYALKGVSKETVNELAKVAMPFMMQMAMLGAQAATGQLGEGQMNLLDTVIEAEANK